MERRAVLRTVSIVGTAGLAGCVGGLGGGDAAATGYDDWFDGVGNYNGTTVGRTGVETVTVTVGASGNNGNFAFAPAAVEVASGTTVRWRWTGEGGRHNVIAESDGFASEFASREGYTFEHRFEETGVHKYYCKPHLSLGMKGAVRVVE